MRLALEELEIIMTQLLKLKNMVLNDTMELSLLDDNDDLFEIYIKVLSLLGDTIFKLKQTMNAVRTADDL